MGACVEMGNLLRLVFRSHCDSYGPNEPDVFVDFENAQPTEIEAEVYQLTGKALEQAHWILEDLESYGDGATKMIKSAISHPEDAGFRDQAWGTLVPLVLRLKNYYEFSVQLEQVVPLLLWELCSGPLPPVEQLEARQALATQLAHILDFVLRFDALKMQTPAVQNDFSYYRRAMSRRTLAYGAYKDEESVEEVLVPCDEANTISFFYAQSAPMLTALTNATSRFVKEHEQLPIENTTDMLATMTAVCRTMADNSELVQRFAKEEETLFFCLRVMVGATVLFDHVHPTGAFARNSAVDVKSVVRVLRNQPAEKVEALLNTLRYTSRHFGDPATPKGLKALLAPPAGSGSAP